MYVARVEAEDVTRTGAFGAAKQCSDGEALDGAFPEGKTGRLKFLSDGLIIFGQSEITAVGTRWGVTLSAGVIVQRKVENAQVTLTAHWRGGHMLE